MDLSEDQDSSLLDVQQQRLSFLVKKSRKLEARLAELRSEDRQMELKDLSLSDCSEDNHKEVKGLIDLVNQLKAEYYCLSYQTNVYNGLIPPGLIDYMPDQPVESTLAMGESSGSSSHITSNSSGAEQSHIAEDADGKDQMVIWIALICAVLTPVNTPTSSRASGVIPETSDTQSWSCPHCSFKNHPAIDVCEICEHQRYKFKDSNPVNPPRKVSWDFYTPSLQNFTSATLLYYLSQLGVNNNTIIEKTSIVDETNKSSTDLPTEKAKVDEVSKKTQTVPKLTTLIEPVDDPPQPSDKPVTKELPKEPPKELPKESPTIPSPIIRDKLQTDTVRPRKRIKISPKDLLDRNSLTLYHLIHAPISRGKRIG
uniref:RanBP2-type domain-containing protein n=1 Tax=Tetranychus urticae TaxID=32264 RepID=T1KTH4_TETUR